jgi:hypothetical protein
MPESERIILSANRPYFAPHAGFFFKAHISHWFVILDRVQFPRGTTWLTRNRFKNDQGTLWLTVPVWKKGLGLQMIDEVRVCREGRWHKKHLASLKNAYGKAPYFEECNDLVETVVSLEYERLLDMNMAIIRGAMKALGMAPRMRFLSEMEVDSKGDRILIDLCRKVGASHFLIQAAARKYLDAASFRKAGVRLLFFKPPEPVYPQLWGNFIPNLSLLDLLLNCGPKSRDILLKGLES